MNLHARTITNAFRYLGSVITSTIALTRVMKNHVRIKTANRGCSSVVMDDAFIQRGAAVSHIFRFFLPFRKLREFQKYNETLDDLSFRPIINILPLFQQCPLNL